MTRPKATEEKRKEMFLEKVERTDSCWKWKGTKSSTGYGMFYDGQKPVKAHRLSYQFFKGRLLCTESLLHSCSNRICVNPEHLRIGTARENWKDSLAIGSAAVGYKNGSSKLNREQVDQIRSMYIPWKMGSLKLSRIFKVSRTAILNAVSNKSYRLENAYGA